MNEQTPCVGIGDIDSDVPDELQRVMDQNSANLTDMIVQRHTQTGSSEYFLVDIPPHKLHGYTSEVRMPLLRSAERYTAARTPHGNHDAG